VAKVNTKMTKANPTARLAAHATLDISAMAAVRPVAAAARRVRQVGSRLPRAYGTVSASSALRGRMRKARHTVTARIALKANSKITRASLLVLLAIRVAVALFAMLVDWNPMVVVFRAPMAAGRPVTWSGTPRALSVSLGVTATLRGAMMRSHTAMTARLADTN
jgi:hypothetical protein